MLNFSHCLSRVRSILIENLKATLIIDSGVYAGRQHIFSHTFGTVYEPYLLKKHLTS